jgi:hypothetical protein
VGYDVLELDNAALFEIHSLSLDDCDFDGQSDSEDDNSCVSKEKLLFNETIPQGDDAFVVAHSKQKKGMLHCE